MAGETVSFHLLENVFSKDNTGMRMMKAFRKDSNVNAALLQFVSDGLAESEEEDIS